ncbi:MAG: diguanylate cyclase [Candidatus Fermentibacteraceae bacterium]|nr:diguanylate cyclase [Candidatus Fermentibacteraceae bacterium]MBN2609614.1 diguanylate cyclase [Candidatus Fermentibacteraceae bacterium]
MADRKDRDRFGGAGVDSLTGLYDRSWLDQLDDTYRCGKGPFSLLMLDVDHFKLINDIYGHLAGDKVLKQTALTIQVNLKETDTALRFGGDEFIILLPGTGEDGALDLSQRLIYEINRVSFTSGLKVSISIGVSESRCTDESVMDLVSRADKALYKAKEMGRGRFFFFTEKLTDSDVPEISFSHLVGRRQELQKLRQLLEESVTDSTRFAVLSGEAGVGKTRLADELLHYCDFMKSIVVRNSMMEHTQNQPFSLLIKPLSEALSQLTGAEMKIVRNEVEPVHPATLDLFPDFTAAVSDDTVYFREERIRFRIFRDISAILASISGIHPVTMILDDLQWVPEPDLALLSFVARNTQSANIFYLCILRRDDKSGDIFSKLSSIRTSLPLLNMELEKLTDDEMRNLILFGLKDPNVPPRVQEFLIAQSGGNPLFLLELLTACVDSGYITRSKSGEKSYNLPENLEVPDSIGKIITLKLSSVSREAVDLLKIVSLSPDQSSISLLEGMTGRDRVELARRLDECIKAGLIEEVADSGGGFLFRFTHGAVRDYLSSDLPESLRVTYHQRMAAYFEDLYEAGDRELLTAVAYHYSRSQDSENASKYALKAARQAFNRGANRDAIHWYNVHLSRVSNGGGPAGTFDVFINLGSLYSITGQVEEADGYLKKALALAEDPREMAAVYLRLGRNNLNRSLYPETLEYYDRAVSICMEAEPDDPVIRRTLVETLIGTSFVHRLQGDYQDAIHCLDRASEIISKNGGEVPEEIQALYCTRKADVISELGSQDEAIGLYEKALEMYIRIDDLQGQGTVLNNMHGIYSSRGDYARSLSTLEEVIRINMNLDDRLGLAIAYYNTAEYYLEINMLDLSREYYEKYMELNDVIKNELGIGYGSYGLAKLHWLEGDLEKSRFYFEGAVEIFEKLSVDSMRTSCELMQAQIYIHLDEFDSAREILRAIDDETLNPTVELSTRFMKGLVRLNDPGAGRRELEEAENLFRKVIGSSMDHSEVELAMYYRALVEVLQKLGCGERTLDALREGSLRLAERLGRIRSYSIRNSMMTRREIADFIRICRDGGLPFPPEGFFFNTTVD